MNDVVHDVYQYINAHSLAVELLLYMLYFLMLKLCIMSQQCYFGILLYCRAPFDLAILLLAFMSVMILILWSENYGDSSAKALHSFTDAMNTIREGMIYATTVVLRY